MSKIEDAEDQAADDAVEITTEETGKEEPISEEYLTTAEVANLTKMSASFFEKKRCTGGGPRFGRYGRNVRYRRSDIEKFMEDGLRKSTSDPGNAPDDGHGT